MQVETETRRHGWTNGPIFCAIPAAGSGEGITGVPIASGPVSGVLLSVVLAALVLATWWLMRRWSGAPAAAPASVLVPEASAGVAPSGVAAELPADDRELTRV